MAVTFSQGKHFLLSDSELYNAVVTKVERFNRKGYSLYELWVEIFDKVTCAEGKENDEGEVIETSLGKRIKCTLWLNEDGEFSKHAKNLIEVLAESKEMDVNDEDFYIEDVVGGLCRVQVKNDEKEDENGFRYSKIDTSKVYPPKAETKEKYKLYKRWKSQQEQEKSNKVTGNIGKSSRDEGGDSRPFKKSERKEPERKEPERKEPERKEPEKDDDNPFSAFTD